MTAPRRRTTRPAPKAVDPIPAKEAGPKYPVVYYNPRIPDERFVMTGSVYFHRFSRGRFVAKNASEEQAVRAALRYHGRDVADAWRGDDLEEAMESDDGRFLTYNRQAWKDYRRFHP